MELNKLKQIFENYGGMEVTSPSRYDIEPITLEELFNSIADSADVEVLDAFKDFVEDGDDELKIAYNAFVAALKQNNWFEDNNIEDEDYVQISTRYPQIKVVYEAYYSDFLEDSSMNF